MTGLTTHWSVALTIDDELDDRVRVEAERYLRLKLHGVNSVGETTIGHRFVVDSVGGWAILRFARGATGYAVELVTYGDPELSSEEIVSLRDEAQTAVRAIAA